MTTIGISGVMKIMTMTRVQQRHQSRARLLHNAVSNRISRWAVLSCSTILFLFTTGCLHTKAHYQSAHGKGARYSIYRAEFRDGMLHVDGSVNGGGNSGLYGFGVEVLKAEDESGNRLELKHARMYLQKGFVFQLRFEAPVENATQFKYELILFGHRDQQRLEGSIEIRHNPREALIRRSQSGETVPSRCEKRQQSGQSSSVAMIPQAEQPQPAENFSE